VAREEIRFSAHFQLVLARLRHRSVATAGSLAIFLVEFGKISALLLPTLLLILR